MGLGIAEDPPAGAAKTTGRFSVEFSAQRLAEACLDSFQQSPDYSKVAFYRPLARVIQPEAEAFEVKASCRVRYKIFRIRLGIVLVGRVSPDGILTIERTSLRGSNLILRLFTRIMRREIEKSYDLNGGLPAGSKFSNLHLIAGEYIQIAGEVS